MNTVCPSEERLKSLIMEAFDELSAPDPARIGQIASTLASKTKKQANRRSRSRHQWLFWILLGSSMTAAAWWGSSYLLPKPAETPVQIKLEKSEPVIKSSQSAPNNEMTKEPEESGVTKHSRSKTSPIIDQREQY